ncbi:YjcZ family sporulation protein [Bacillus salipaludis]
MNPLGWRCLNMSGGATSGFALIVVLFILLIIVGASFMMY